MIGVVYGTTGELIKLAPVLRGLAGRGTPALGITTAQQVRQLRPFLGDFGLPEPDVWLARGFRGADLERPVHIPPWLATVARGTARERRDLGRRLRSDGRPPMLLVHGDTFTTVLGALLGKVLGMPVGHVEAGMRSGDWRNPFPEELNRRAAARLVDVHFAPGPRPVGNLRRERPRGRIVDTHLNTVWDAVELARDAGDPGIPLPPEPFGLVSLHRFELLERPEALRAVLELLHAHSRTEPLLFVDHSTTAAALARHGLEFFFDERLRRIPRLRYFPFIALLQRSRFLVTDSGGCQEECAFLGHPCLIHRAVSEHDTGLDTSVVLSRMDLATVRAFLADPERHRIAMAPPPDRPTDRILAELEALGAIPAPAADAHV